ncbi:MAG: trigger factor [Parcubacteria group bacterium]|nr:trigger factor [Parcubacteria group bacterium]
MNVSKEALDQAQVKLTIELTADEFLPFIEKAGRRLAEQVNIAGFRKGQAPLEMIYKQVGKMAVYEQAAELAVQKTLPEAIAQEKLRTVGQPAIAIDKLAPQNPFVYTATAPLMPDVKVGDIQKINAQKEEATVTSDETEQVLRNIRRMRATEKLVEREAKLGDKVEVSFKVFLDNVPVDGGSSEKYPLTLGDKTMIPGFEEQVLGMKTGQDKEFKLAFPADYNRKMLASKTCDFQVKVSAVYEVILPEFDDVFAQSVGKFKTAAEMKTSVEDHLRQEKQQTADTKFERDLLEQLINLSTFGTIPEVMVTQEAQVMIGELEQNIARQGLKFDDYLVHLKKDRKQLMLDLAPDAVKRIKSALVIRALAEDRKIEASKEEIEAELHDLEHAYAGNEAALRQVRSPAHYEYMSFVIRNRKTLHWLKDEIIKAK